MLYSKSSLVVFANALTAIFLLSSYSLAQGPDCVADRNDLDSAGVVMKGGPSKGQCIDTSSKRAIRIIENTESGVTIANFRYDHQFWNAFIPKQAIKEVQFLNVDLDAEKLSKHGVNVFHSHLRFILDEQSPALLLKEQSGQNTQTNVRVNDIIISMNFMATKGVDYNPVKGFKSEEYLSVLQVYATSDEAKTRFVDQKLNVYTVSLNVDRRQSWNIFMTGLRRSQEEQYSISYQTWNSNCTLEAFNILDQALKLDYVIHVSPFHFRVLDIKDENFMPSLRALELRGLVRKPYQVHSMNKEFGFPQYHSYWTRFQ